MKLRFAFFVLLVVWVAAAVSSVALAFARSAPGGELRRGLAGAGLAHGGGQPTRSINDGVFTADQAKRGEATYTQACSSCHGSDLNGDGFAPPLAGADFSSNWNELSVGDLFERIRISMPPDGPGKVPDQGKADIIAFLLDANKYPTGTTELEPKTEVLKQIKIELKK
jgi:mono/diheme cytochrome c family protein